jgi:hypothetical protein
LQVLGAAYVFQYRFDGARLVMLRYFMRANPESDSGLSNRLRYPAKKRTTTALVEAMPNKKAGVAAGFCLVSIR